MSDGVESQIRTSRVGAKPSYRCYLRAFSCAFVNLLPLTWRVRSPKCYLNGNVYNLSDSAEQNEFVVRFSSHILFTYRHSFEPLPEPAAHSPSEALSNPRRFGSLFRQQGKVITSDIGWGCMIRVFQMAIAQALLSLVFKGPISKPAEEHILYLPPSYLEQDPGASLHSDEQEKAAQSPTSITTNLINSRPCLQVQSDEQDGQRTGEAGLNEPDMDECHTNEEGSEGPLPEGKLFEVNPDEASYDEKNLRHSHKEDTGPVMARAVQKRNRANLRLSVKGVDVDLGVDHNCVHPWRLLPILNMFVDSSLARFGIHRIVQAGSALFKIRSGQWFGPTSCSEVVTALINGSPCVEGIPSEPLYVGKSNVAAYHATESIIDVPAIKRLLTQGGADAVIVFVSLRLGLDCFNLTYQPFLHKCFLINGFQGIAGGGPLTSAYWFIAASNEFLFYLDPHSPVQPALTTLTEDIEVVESAVGDRLIRFGIARAKMNGLRLTEKQFEQTFFPSFPKQLPWRALNPSLTLVFMVQVSMLRFEVYDRNRASPMWTGWSSVFKQQTNRKFWASVTWILKPPTVCPWNTTDSLPFS